MRRLPTRVTLARQSAVDSAEGRRCAHCGDLIDPADWCPGCRTAGRACRAPHRRLHKRADAAFCDAECRAEHRNSFIRDCT